ncbi:sensor domain-containing diguanylate cyclase [Salinimonas sp. HHU 13199]|uniref:diguanylate cyclase n=1 Tax=Salinimonas profundi TaxID=2729140 RepID=A0ABR8LNH4_9ALTE|nr:sensor domain-containing diguanylate cyclase [Salinimonas profundi]MBD3585972.1 sensor domain-containing diguanylate cyclase [Salinimonas profundi]
MTNNYKNLLQQLPSCLIYKQHNSSTVYLSDTLAQHLKLTQVTFSDEAACPVRFYCSRTGVELTGDASPLTLSQGAGSLCQHVVLQSGDQRFYTRLQSKTVDDRSTRWIITDISFEQHDQTRHRQSDWQEKLSFSMMLSSISTRLINVKASEADALIEQSLGTFGAYLKAQRCYLFCFSDDNLLMDNTHEWVEEGVTPFKEDLQHVPVAEQLPYFNTVIKQDHAFVVSDVNQLPASAALEKAEFQREGIRAVLCVAVHVNGELFGFIGCDFLTGTHCWTDHEIKSMKLIGEMVSETLASISTRQSLHRVQQELLQANARLKVLVNLDGLTHIANRRHFDETLNLQWRNITDHGLSLLIIDVDSFKQYNDSYGHQAGDEVLQAIASVLDDVASSLNGLAARYGGEEFAIILPGHQGKRAITAAFRVMRAISTLNIEFSACADFDRVTVSIGLSDSDSATSPQSLINQADAALYNAKQSGRNKVVRFPSTQLASPSQVATDVYK